MADDIELNIDLSGPAKVEKVKHKKKPVVRLPPAPPWPRPLARATTLAIFR